ncbi:Reverse transcriptase zinc-binding domain [Macleaya cordata]|uniref:Reverse transcriptase zinc-binding domain n=1 Tax=Macleaya cordata TaxID=56857 RepID=A0A200QFA5_MACCD|nr:Reverse transcriptase zinc-binding domain [Macleaya cordata]
MRDVLNEHTCWYVGNGMQINIWRDPWVPSIPGFRVEGLISSHNRIHRVADLIHHSQRCWNTTLICDCFNEFEANAIMKIRLPCSDEKDVLLWMQTTNGDFTTKSAYRTLHQMEPSSSSTSNTNSKFRWKSYWKIKGISPRIHLFLWRVINHAIALRSVLARHISTVDPSCPLCQKEIETTDHLFLKCELVRKIWFGSPISLRIPDNDTEFTLESLFNCWLASPSSYEVLKLGCAIIWSIWKMRNRCVFENFKPDIRASIQMAIHIYNDHSPSSDLSHVEAPDITDHNVPLTQRWNPHDATTVKINVDGATATRTIAAGIIARNHLGDVMNCRTYFDNTWIGVDAAIEAEARGFLKGLELAREMHAQQPNTRFVIEGDSKKVVSYINDDRLIYPWRIRSILQDCSSIKKTHGFLVSFIPRLENSTAHALAKFAISNKLSSSWMASHPTCISESVLFDRQAIIDD